MKSLLISVSLLMNGALFATLAMRPALAPPAVRDFFSGVARFVSTSHGKSAMAGVAAGPAAAQKPRPGTLWSTLKSDDLHALVARLRAGGFPPYLIRAIIQTEVEARYGTRLRELSMPDPDAPFWKATGSLGMDPKRMAEYTQLAHERSDLLKDLLGAFTYHDNGSLTTNAARRYGTLPQEKIDQLERINSDYADLTNQVRSSMNGITLPEDQEKIALLDREKRVDLAALLTPAELEDYDMRNSNVTARLRQAMALFKADEDEFSLIYKIEEGYNDRINPTNLIAMTPAQQSDFLRQRQTSQKEMDAQLQTALGDQRYAEFVRSSDRDYQQLTKLAERENLPAQAVNQAYDLRSNVSQESNRIYNDATLDYDQKLLAMQSLAQTTRQQMLAALGPTAGDAYLKSSAGWLTSVERGAAVTFNPGGGTTTRGLRNPNAPTPVMINTTSSIIRVPGGP